MSRSPPRSNKIANTVSGPVTTSSTTSNIRKVDYATMTPGKLAESFNAPTINRFYRYLSLFITYHESTLNTERRELFAERRKEINNEIVKEIA